MSYPVVGSDQYHAKLAQLVRAAKGKYTPEQVRKQYAALCDSCHNPRKGNGKVRSSTSIDKRDMPKNCREMQPTKGGSSDPKQCWNPKGKRRAT